MRDHKNRIEKLKSSPLETVSCNICETDDFEQKLYPIDSGILVKCNKCGLYYANPRRTDIINKIAKDQTPDILYEGKN